MTYIKWKDEVESYLVSLPQEEKQKIFSYFSEMYADKRDAGKSEAQIIEEFGAPYDVVKKILAESKENSAPAQDAQPQVNGGNNYNYNYYNYNYGGAPQGAMPQNEAHGGGKELPQKSAPPERTAPPPPPAQEKPKSDAGKIVLAIFLTILLIALSIFLIGAPIAGIVQGFVTIAAAIGAFVADKGAVGFTVANIGFGLINVGLSFMLLGPFTLLHKFLWKKLIAYSKGE